MKTGWVVKKLGEVCDFENGDRGKNYPSKSCRTAKGIAFINAGHLTNSGIDIRNLDYISKERYDLLGSGKVKRGDILFCLRGSLGKFSIANELSIGAIASSLIIIRNKESVLKKFILAYLGSELCSNMISKYSNGAAQPNLSAGNLKQFLIPVPPLSEQQRIVAILDDAFAAVAKAKENAERNLQNARELFESVLEDVFANPGEDWDERKLGEITKIRSGYSFDSKDFSANNQVKSIKITNVGVQEFIEESNNLLPKEYEVEFAKFLVKAGEIAIALTRSVISKGLKVAIVPQNYNNSLLNQRVAVIQGNNRALLNYYVYHFLCTNQIKNYVLKQANTLMQPNLSLGDLVNIKINVPPLYEQQKIIERLDSLSRETRKLELIYQKKLTELGKLKKSILQKAFSGEL